MRYVGFLRGINIGRAKQVKMSLLKAMFEDMGYVQVKTLLNSGNVVFDAPETNPAVLKEKIEQNLFKTFGFEVPTIIRTAQNIQQIVVADPFKGLSVTDNTRLYITFLSAPKKSSLSIPYLTSDFKILALTDTEIFSAIEISPNKNTTDLMGIIEKEWGKNITTRNWNTVQKVEKLLVKA